ncbi:MAG TPA: DUF2339 domain-containing protein, partial [Candidatus Acidoferrales bacterium]|nr:DUF2339 domain-containing protein [Candidatus Acidoferrales bacterium]
MNEPRKTRYAGFVIIAVLFFGLLVISSQRGLDTRIEGAFFLSLGALIAWMIVRALRAREDARRAEERFEEIEGRLNAIQQHLAGRVNKLEEDLARLQSGTVPPGVQQPAGEAKAATAEPAKPTPVQPLAPGALPATVPPATPVQPPAAATPAPPTSAPAAREAATLSGTALRGGIEGLPPAAPTLKEATADALSKQGLPIPPPLQARTPLRPGPSFRAKLPDIEEMLGTNWLSKLGITGLVLGIAFFLALEATTPKSRVALGYVCGLAMLGAGIYFERVPRYRLLARVGIAGGWPLLFFVTYAMYHVPAARIPGLSPEGDLVLMLVVAGAMVA